MRLGIDTAATGGTLIVIGLVHLLAPGRLLTAATVAYDRTLDVTFSPESKAVRRVRLVGLVMIALGTILSAGEETHSVAIEKHN